MRDIFSKFILILLILIMPLLSCNKNISLNNKYSTNPDNQLSVYTEDIIDSNTYIKEVTNNIYDLNSWEEIKQPIVTDLHNVKFESIKFHNAISREQLYNLLPSSKEKSPSYQHESYFFPISFQNNTLLFYYSLVRSLDLKTKKITSLKYDPALHAPWSMLGNKFLNSNIGNFIILSSNKLIQIENNRITAYDYYSGELMWQTPIKIGGMYPEFGNKLIPTDNGILINSIDPFIIYLVDSENGTIKWIYDAEKKYGNLSEVYHQPGPMAYYRSFNLSVEFTFNDGIIANLSYRTKAKTPAESDSIDKYLLISWDGKLVAELKYKPIGYKEDKYFFSYEDLSSKKHYFGLAYLTNDNLLWKNEIPLKLSDFYYGDNSYFQVVWNDCISNDIPEKEYIILVGRNDKEDIIDGYSALNGYKVWSNYYLKESIHDIYIYNDITIIYKSLPDNKGDSIIITSNSTGALLKEYLLATKTSRSLRKVIKISDYYILILNDCIIELSRNSVKLGSYESVFEHFFSDNAVVIMENNNWFVLAFVPVSRGGEPGGYIITFSKNKNL